MKHYKEIIPLVVFQLGAKYREIRQKRRWQVYDRDNYTCVRCGLEGNTVIFWYDTREKGWGLHVDLYYVSGKEMVMMTLDHHIPKSKGGTNHIDNLKCMCSPCNGKKGNKFPWDIMDTKKVV